MLIGVDVGGTFTDAVLVTPDGLVSAKVPTTPEDQSRGVLAAVAAVLSRAEVPGSAVERFAHGMTVATNALLEGRAAPAALVATEGFTDVVELARQNRPELYRLQARGPEPLVPPQRRVAVHERMLPEGVAMALEEAEAYRVARAVADTGAVAVAVVLLHAYRHPEHEQRIREALTELAPGISVHLSSELVGTFREYERAATTEVDAALSPLLAGYLRRLAAKADTAGLPVPQIMASHGGLISLETAAAHAALTVLSGPAGGAAGAAVAAAAAGVQDALCLDMGGTSCDVCLLTDGHVAEAAGRSVAGRPIALPALAVDTVGAGGGSVAWRDPGGALAVGPRSAGADPGPAGYGRGGHEPTVTDANLVLGLLDPRTPLAGGVRLNKDAARRAVGRLADELGLGLEATARGIRAVACAEMAGALTGITVDRGIDPREHTLVAFGGAGGLHATDIADSLGMTSILIPGRAGVLAALGLVLAPERHDAQRSVLLSGPDLELRRIHAISRSLRDRATASFTTPPAAILARWDLRYVGQSFELTVEAGLEPTPEELRQRFEAEHAARYGFIEPDGEIELVTVRVSAFGATPQGDLAGGPRREVSGVLALEETTVWIPPHWRGEIDTAGTVWLWTRSNSPS